MLAEKRFNEETLEHESKFELWLNDNDLYIIKQALELRIMQTKSTRDKCNISPCDKEAEPNKHIEAITRLANELNITL